MIARISRPSSICHWILRTGPSPRKADLSREPPISRPPPIGRADWVGDCGRPTNVVRRASPTLTPRAHAIRLAGPRCAAVPRLPATTTKRRPHRPCGDPPPAQSIRAGTARGLTFFFFFFWSAAPFRISPASCRCYGRAGDPHPLYACLFGLYAAAGRHPPPRRRQPPARFRPPPPPSPPPSSPSRRPSAGPPPPPPAAPSHRKKRISAAAAAAAGDVAAVAAAQHGRVAACRGACRCGGCGRSSVYHPLGHYPLSPSPSFFFFFS